MRLSELILETPQFGGLWSFLTEIWSKMWSKMAKMSHFQRYFANRSRKCIIFELNRRVSSSYIFQGAMWGVCEASVPRYERKSDQNWLNYENVTFSALFRERVSKMHNFGAQSTCLIELHLSRGYVRGLWGFGTEIWWYMKYDEIVCIW
jgi:hypothetical protein